MSIHLDERLRREQLLDERMRKAFETLLERKKLYNRWVWRSKLGPRAFVLSLSAFLLVYTYILVIIPAAATFLPTLVIVILLSEAGVLVVAAPLIDKKIATYRLQDEEEVFLEVYPALQDLERHIQGPLPEWSKEGATAFYKSNVPLTTLACRVVYGP